MSFIKRSDELISHRSLIIIFIFFMPLATTAEKVFHLPLKLRADSTLMVKTSGPGGGGSTHAWMLSTVMMSCSTLGLTNNQLDYDNEEIMTIDNFDTSTATKDFRCFSHMFLQTLAWFQDRMK